MSVSHRVVVLTGPAVQHRYVSAALAMLPNVVAIVVVRQPADPGVKRILRAIRRFGLTGLLSRTLLKLALRVTGETARRDRDLERVLGKCDFPNDVPLFNTVGVNSPQTQTLLRKLRPDILCVYGTYIVSEPTLSIANYLALNLHTGISPRYRGADCEFWPLHERELHWIGATVHCCTADVDGGAILGTASAELQPQDRLGGIFGRCVIAGSALYKRVIQDLLIGQELRTIPQDLSVGRQYKVAMRGWRAELRVAWALRRGLIGDHLSGLEATEIFQKDNQAGRVQVKPRRLR
jgi:methionyl-tRNA formyltransferase